MERWQGKVAVVTGASSGVGACIAKYLVERGLLVAGLARRTGRIEDLSRNLSDADGRLIPLRCDLTKEEAILKTFKAITEQLGPIHILINSAGLSKSGSLIDGSTEEWRRIFEVNVIALSICTREALKIMKHYSINGHIIHLNSIAGHYVPSLPESSFSVYPASKHALTALTESLRQELRHNKMGIKVTSISPGVVNPEYQDGLAEQLKEPKNGVPSLTPEDIAEAVVYVLSTAPHVHVQELTLRPLGEMF